MKIKTSKHGDAAVLSARKNLITSFSGKNGKRKAEVFVKIATRKEPHLSAELVREICATGIGYRQVKLALQLGGRG